MMLMIVIMGKIIQNCTNNTTEDKIHILIQLDGNVQLMSSFILDLIRPLAVPYNYNPVQVGHG